MYINLRKKFEKWAWKKNYRFHPTHCLWLFLLTSSTSTETSTYHQWIDVAASRHLFLRDFGARRPQKIRTKVVLSKTWKITDKRDWELHGGRVTSWQQIHIPFFNHFWRWFFLWTKGGICWFHGAYFVKTTGLNIEFMVAPKIKNEPFSPEKWWF